jgi:hypothetical protein
VGGISALSSGPLASSAERFLDRDLVLVGAGSASAPSSPVVEVLAAALADGFLARGFGGAFLGRSGLGRFLMRDERRGSEGSAVVALRGIYNV